MHKEIEYLRGKVKEECEEMVGRMKKGKRMTADDLNKIETISGIAANMAIIDGYDVAKHELEKHGMTQYHHEGIGYDTDKMKHDINKHSKI